MALGTRVVARLCHESRELVERHREPADRKWFETRSAPVEGQALASSPSGRGIRVAVITKLPSIASNVKYGTINLTCRRGATRDTLTRIRPMVKTEPKRWSSS